jgi:hypothetical protein
MLIQLQSRTAKHDIGKRQHSMERCFSRSKRYGYKRARWRRLWRVLIQEYLTCAIQNIIMLVRNTKEQDSAAQACSCTILVDTLKSPMYMGKRRCSHVQETQKELQPRIQNVSRSPDN